MFGGYNSIYYEVIASQTSTNCNRLTWRDVVNVKYFCHITVVIPGSGISFSKFLVSRHLLKLFYDELRSFSTFFALNFDKNLAVE